SFFPPGGLDPVLDGGVGDEDAVVAPQVPTGGLIGQAVFGDQTDGPLLHAAGVSAVTQGQVGDIDGEATATSEAAMPPERDTQANGGVGPSGPEVVQGARAHRIAAGAVAAARAGPRWPVATAPLDPRLGQVFDTRDALAAVGDILTWTSHRLLS